MWTLFALAFARSGAATCAFLGGAGCGCLGGTSADGGLTGTIAMKSAGPAAIAIVSAATSRALRHASCVCGPSKASPRSTICWNRLTARLCGSAGMAAAGASAFGAACFGMAFFGTGSRGGTSETLGAVECDGAHGGALPQCTVRGGSPGGGHIRGGIGLVFGATGGGPCGGLAGGGLGSCGR